MGKRMVELSCMAGWMDEFLLRGYVMYYNSGPPLVETECCRLQRVTLPD